MRTETAEEALVRCKREKFSGSLVIHFMDGIDRNIEQHSKWKTPPRNGTVDLSEVKG